MRTLLLSAALLVAVPLSAQKLVPGEYVTEGGWGNLTLKRGSKGALAFSIETVGANGHSCSLEGEVRNGSATLEGLDEGEPCIVTLAAVEGGVEVGSESDACRIFCGARAGFTGTYLRLPVSCSPKVVAATRKTFKQLYDARKFTAARAKLEPLLESCDSFLDTWTTGRIRNDLAVTLHKLGDLEGCRAVLEPLREDAEMTDQELRENYPPSDAESLMPIVRATRTNLRLCRERD